MTSRAHTRLAASAVLAAALAASPSASATVPPKVHEAFFKARVEGVQTTTWTADHQPTVRCDSRYTGSGKERVTFASTRAVKIRAFRLGRGRVTFASSRGEAVLPTRGAVRRSGTLTLAPPTPECAVGDGDGDGQPPASDCGLKRIASLPLAVAYDALKPDRITLSRSYTNDDRRPAFRNCPSMGESWPNLLSRDDRNRTAGETLPRDDLFDRRQGKTIVIGRGKIRGGSDGVSFTTRIRWDLTLTRLRR